MFYLLGVFSHWIGGNRIALTIDKRRSKIARNSAFDCLLSPVWRLMVIKNPVSNNFVSSFVESINFFDFTYPGVVLCVRH